MPISNLQIAGIGKNVVIPLLVMPHVLISTFLIGIAIIGPIAEYMGVLTKRPHYDRFARNSAKFQLLLFASGSALAFMFLFALISLFPVFWSFMQNTFFWVLLAEAFMFVGEVVVVYAWYYTWDIMAYRKNLHIIIGLMTGLFGLAQMTFINVVASYMLTPTAAPATNVGWTFFNPTYMPLEMHRFVGNISYAGFLIAGWGAYRYLRSTGEDDRRYYDWMGHWGIAWGFGFLILQPIIGYDYMKEIRAHNPQAFQYLMMGDKTFLFNLLMIELLVMSVCSAAYFLYKIKFAVKPMPRLRRTSAAALGTLAVLGLLDVIPADWYLVPQIGLVFGKKVDPNINLGQAPPIPLGAMYPWKFAGLIGLMLVGVFALALYMKAANQGFHWGRVSRASQYLLLTLSVTVTLTMMTMGYARETARRAGPENYLVKGCITFQQKYVGGGCPGLPKETP